MNVLDKSPFFYLCNSYINSYKDITAYGQIIDICIKFLRNLKLLYSDSSQEFEKYCNNIYYWLYYEIMDNNLFDEKTLTVFLMQKEANGGTTKNKDCSNMDLYNNLAEAENYVMLSIFNNNIHDIQDILKQKTYPEICSCQEFINQCVSLYKRIHKKYSPNCKYTNTTLLTCLAVKMFKTNYEEYLSEEKKKYEFPELSSSTDKNINIEECLLQTNGIELASVHSDQLDNPISFTVPTTLTEPAGKTVPAAFGTIAGVSSVLALLYKVITNFYLNI
ncbi:hypothetical protein PCYB_005120 [Plasmodium cynomolgi strain B]|uniref:CYIR protein n=1 Tax=Plasmodium cynomolgi (strain B) TaxID=1120755 RepID=K6UNS5_PLACD|nr:hypothetical protein PCYB_005120 [Plasmodium cynomolgi strain B]GAB69763.1 hypothetical protein PCYB_005120 [Plasmodium cynomolgi strain B]